MCVCFRQQRGRRVHACGRTAESDAGGSGRRLGPSSEGQWRHGIRAGVIHPDHLETADRVFYESVSCAHVTQSTLVFLCHGEAFLSCIMLISCTFVVLINYCM